MEHDRAEFNIDVEAEDADVTWYRDGKKIIPEQVGIRGSSQNRWVSEDPPRIGGHQRILPEQVGIRGSS